jgi:hypothetical protein
MATGKGVVQGYTAVAAVDAKAQIIVDAQAHGTGTEQELLLPVVAALAPHATATTLITADTGYHSEANLRALAAEGRPALIADHGRRARDERFATQARHQQWPDSLHDKSRVPTRLPLYPPDDFTHCPVARTCVCPAGKSLYRQGKDQVIRGAAPLSWARRATGCRVRSAPASCARPIARRRGR